MIKTWDEEKDGKSNVLNTSDEDSYDYSYDKRDQDDSDDDQPDPIRNNSSNENLTNSHSEIDWNSVETHRHLNRLFLDPYNNLDKYKASNEKEAMPQRSPTDFESNVVSDVLNQIRENMIVEINRGLAETLLYYQTIKDEVKMKIHKDVIESQLFGNKLMFLLSIEVISRNCASRYKNWANKNSPFQLYLFEIDFYLSKQQLNLLK